MDAAPLPTALEALHVLLGSLQAQVQSLEAENKLLRQKLDLFIRRYFGTGTSEAFDPQQLELILAGLLASHAPVPASAAQQAAAQAAASSERSTARKPAVRQPLPEHLPTERVVIEPAEVQLAPALWKQIGEEVTEELDWKPGQFLRRLYIRPKYVRREVEPAAPVLAASSALPLASAAVEPAAPPVVIAPLPARLIEKGLPGAGLLAHVILSKYEHHLPLYRQEKIYWEQHGVKLTRQTLAEWIEQGAWWLRPVY